MPNDASQSTAAGEVSAARAAVGDITAEAEFCVSPIGLLRRENGEIALASEVLRLRSAWLRVIQAENSCSVTGQPCRDPRKCGCAAEQEMLILEAEA